MTSAVILKKSSDELLESLHHCHLAWKTVVLREQTEHGSSETGSEVSKKYMTRGSGRNETS